LANGETNKRSFEVEEFSATIGFTSVVFSSLITATFSSFFSAEGLALPDLKLLTIP
jgi:hypothetical protein